MIPAKGRSYARAGSAEDARKALAEAFAAMENTGERWYASELHRLSGEVALISNPAASSEADRCFRIAIDMARSSGAKLWELRSASNLARLLAKQGKRDQARTMLADIYNWFTEGFDTADLKNATALLGELST